MFRLKQFRRRVMGRSAEARIRMWMGISNSERAARSGAVGGGMGRDRVGDGLSMGTNNFLKVA